MSEIKELDIKKESIQLICLKCGCNKFTMNTDYLNSYGQLACPMCFSNRITIVFDKYKHVDGVGR